jgi:hypothetical protein
MDPKFLPYFMLVELFGLTCNGLTLIYILKNFDVKV